jgi:hypothetical protein
MKRHYEIMRVMRTKVVNFRDLFDGKDGILYILDAMNLRVQDLTSVSVSSSYTVCRVNLIKTTSLSKDLILRNNSRASLTG